MKHDWKSYPASLPVRAIFLHKDEFQPRYHLNVDLPVVLIQTDDELQTLLNKDDIDSCDSPQQLKERLSFKLAQHDQHYYTNL